MIGSAPESILRSADRDRPDWFPAYVDVLRDHLAEGRVVQLPVFGVSMRPMIDAQATLVVAGIGSIVIRPGDIVLYEDGGHLICHRALWRRRTPSGYEVLAKGDRVALPPIWVPLVAIVGRVAAIETCGIRRRLDAPGERIRALAVVVRGLAGVLGRRVARTVRNLTMLAPAA